MLTIGKLMRAAKGAASLDEMLELMSGLGIQAEVEELTSQGAAEADAASRREGAKLFQMKAWLASGQPLIAILILPPG